MDSGEDEMKTNGHASTPEQGQGDTLDQKEWRATVEKFHKAHKAKAPKARAAPRQISLDGLIDARASALFVNGTRSTVKSIARHVHADIKFATAKLRDELHAGLLSDLSRVIETQAQLTRDADAANTMMIVRALLATKKIVFDADGRPLGLEVIE
jgi:hypothetical protein